MSEAHDPRDFARLASSADSQATVRARLIQYFHHHAAEGRAEVMRMLTDAGFGVGIAGYLVERQLSRMVQAKVDAMLPAVMEHLAAPKG